MTDEANALQLRRMRTGATALLGAMALLFLISIALRPRYAPLAYVAAFAEAAMVGGLADWFAVTALFRSPLGLPIPHTAIIPRNQDRIARALSNFIHTHFMTRSVLSAELARIDFAAMLSGWLAEEQHRHGLARQVLAVLPALLRDLDDDAAARFLQEQARDTLRTLDAAPLLAELLNVVTDSDYERQLYQAVVDLAADMFERHADSMREQVQQASPKWVPRAIDERIYQRLLQVVRAMLAEMREDDSEWRMRFRRALQRLTHELTDAPERRAHASAVLHELADAPMVHRFVADCWRHAKQWLAADVEADESLIGARLEAGLQRLGERLADTPALQQRVNAWLAAAVTDLLVAHGAQAVGVVERVVREWESETLTRRLELQVGKDLQYIRINGTLVGGLVGLLLYVLSASLSGRLY